jgi:hypothetical protein
MTGRKYEKLTATFPTGYLEENVTDTHTDNPCFYGGVSEVFYIFVFTPCSLVRVQRASVFGIDDGGTGSGETL